MKPLFVSYNGKIFSAEENIFIAENRGLKYGDGLFETIRIHNGEILYFNDHMERMLAGMKALQMQIMPEYSGFFFHKQLLDLGYKCGIGDNARIRITVIRQGRGLYEPVSDLPEYFIEVLPLEKGFEWSEAACELGVFTDVQKSYSAISSFKTLNALPYVLAAIFKRKNELGDAVLLNCSGNISDAVSSNLFWIKNGSIGTPPVSEGGVAGIMQKNLLQLLMDNGLFTQEQSISPPELKQCDEVFLTNVGWGIKPITKFGDKIFDTRQTKEVFQLLMSSLNK